ncbi:Hypothetical predicted protein, partial [Pelobates cultripes]
SLCQAKHQLSSLLWTCGDDPGTDPGGFSVSWEHTTPPQSRHHVATKMAATVCASDPG